MSKNMSQILKNKGPKIDSFGTPYKISEQQLKALLIFVFFCLLERKLSTLGFQIEGEGGINAEAGKFRPK